MKSILYNIYIVYFFIFGRGKSSMTTGILVGVKNETKLNYTKDTTLQKISEDFQNSYKTMIVAAKVDNVIKDLQTHLTKDAKIEFIDMTSEDGIKVYQRSVTFLLIIAVNELFHNAEITVEHSLSKGLYCEVYLGRKLTEEDVRLIEAQMRKIIAENRPIVKSTLPKEEVIELFTQRGQMEKVTLIQSLNRDTVSIYHCGDFYDYLYGAMISQTGVLDLFALDFYETGLIVRVPEFHSPTILPDFQEQAKLAHVFSEAEKWAKILNCDYVSNLNAYNKSGNIGDIIRISEALHEKKTAEIADFIASHTDHVRIILIAGPSSSGKTTFAQRLSIQLRVNDIVPVAISLDDYFLDRIYTPRDEHGEYDFEALEALDVKLFNEHLLKLLAGEAIEVPYYNFLTGKREYRGNVIKLKPDQPIIIEGIHGLNEALTSEIPRDKKYKIYISALTQLAIDGHNRVPTTDARLIRRMVRDHQFRGSDAIKTIKQWPSVRKGEEKNIFPFQEDADVMFNSALIYELGVLKKYATPLLEAVDQTLPEYSEAIRLLNFLEYFEDIIAENEIPNNSIIQEFVGQSCFFR